MKLYLAGRITGSDWRSQIVENMPMEPTYRTTSMGMSFDTVSNSILKTHDCVGPFYVAHDPGPYDDCISPGHRSDYQHPHNIEPQQEWINEACLLSIRQCDVLFAWLDNTDLYGTLIEIGYARAAGKGVWIGSPRQIDELWFAHRTATEFIQAKTPRDALLSLYLESTLSAYPYYDRHGYVYILKAGPFYKIGRAKELDNRIRQVKLQLPFSVDLIHTNETWDCVALEQSLHEVFQGYRCNGEWFQLEDSDVQWICQQRHLDSQAADLPF